MNPAVAPATTLAPAPPAVTARFAMRGPAVRVGDVVLAPKVDPRIRFGGGPVAFTEAHFTVDGKTHPLANTVATPEQIAQAGKTNPPASDGHADPGELIIQGPQYGSSEAQSKRPGYFAAVLQRLMVRFNFGRADNWQNRLRLRESPIVDFERLDGAASNAHLKSLGMKPGDAVLVGDTHCGHLQVYVGDDKTTGEPQVVHSMATKYENKSFRIWVRVLLEMAFSRLFLWRRLDKTGVFQEGFGQYLDRNATGAAIFVTDPRLTQPMRQRLVELVHADKGKGYNGNLLEGTKRKDANGSVIEHNKLIYCSQLWVKNLIRVYAEHGMEPPRYLTCRVNHAIGKPWEMNAYVCTPENVSVSPDIKILGYLGHGKADVIQNLSVMVRPER